MRLFGTRLICILSCIYYASSMLPFECVKMKENRNVRTPSPAAFADLIDESFIRAMN